MPKAVIYLDQSVLNNIAKVRLGLPLDARLKDLHQQIDRRLTRLVEEDLAICPRSEFHDEEGQLHPLLASEASNVIGALSRGVEMLGWVSIRDQQIRRALRRYLGVPVDREMAGDWDHAFTKDPHQPFSGRLVPFGPSVRLDLRDDNAANKADYLEWHSSHAPAGNTKEQLAREHRSFAAAYGPVAFLRSANTRDPSLRLGCAYFYLLVALYDEMTEASLSKPFNGIAAADHFWRFFHSDEFHTVPAVDIFCLINSHTAADGSRRPQPSDVNDGPSIAMALPYVDIMITDRHKGHITRSTGLDKTYKCDIFTSQPKQLERFIDRLGQIAASTHETVCTK